MSVKVIGRKKPKRAEIKKISTFMEYKTAKTRINWTKSN